MGYSLGLILLALAVLVATVLRSRRPNPRHEFVLDIVARMAPRDVAQGFPLAAGTERRKAG